MNKKIIFLVICIMCCNIFSACQKNRTNNTETETETETIWETESETETEVVDIHAGQTKSYLTGQWIDENLATNRPVAIMFENTKACLPHYGISKADVIYECPVEGGITRLMCIFQDYSNMERIGNVRSCRLYYIYFAAEFDAIYFHAGASSNATPVLKSSYIDHIDGIANSGKGCFYRSKDRKSPHNLYTSSNGIQQAIAQNNIRTTISPNYMGHYLFKEEDKQNVLIYGSNAYAVSMYYKNAKPWFEYNSNDGLYYRYEFGEAMVDGMNNQPVAVKNIIIQNCQSSFVSSDSSLLTINHLSGGTGYYITNGRCIEITWSRDSNDSRTRYFDARGQEIYLNPGKTWVEIVQNQHAKENKIYDSKESFLADK